MEKGVKVEMWQCRICLTQTDQIVDIFEYDLEDKIAMFLNITVVQSDQIPSLMCMECVLKLEDFMKFYHLAQKSAERWELAKRLIAPKIQEEGDDRSICLYIENTESNLDSPCSSGVPKGTENTLLNEVNLGNEMEEDEEPDIGGVETNDDDDTNLEMLNEEIIHDKEVEVYDSVSGYDNEMSFQNFNKPPKNSSKAGPNSSKKYPCQICNKYFATYQSVWNHRDRDHNAGRYECKHCGKDFNTNHDRKNHVEACPKKLHTCETCGKVCRYKSKLNEHYRSNPSHRPRHLIIF